MKKRLWQIGNILALLFALVANYLVGAQILPVAAIDDISTKYATLLTPASYAFSIWSIIYVLLIVFALYQARDIFKPDKKNTLPGRVGPYFLIASICNGLWTYVFVSEWLALSVVVLLTLTVSLYLLMKRLKMALNDAPASVIICVWWPLLLYTGWVTVASIVNIASWFQSLGVTVSPFATCAILVVLAGLLLVLLFERNVRELLLACVWGIAAIGVQQVQISGDHIVSAAAFTVSGVLLLAVLAHGYSNRHTNILKKLSHTS